MSLTYGFYNSINGDRKYNAIEMSSIFDGIITDGIFMSIGDAFMVTSSGGMNVSIGEGRAWFNHTWTLNDSPITKIVPASDVLLNRIDAIVLEVNSDAEVRANSIKYITGTPATSPMKPTLTKSELVNQYPLCYISVKSGVMYITQADITNAVGTSECPFITGPLEGISIDALVAQWEAQFEQWFTDYGNSFEVWFNAVKGQLSSDPAGNLQLQIDDIVTDVNSISQAVENTAPLDHNSDTGAYGIGDKNYFGHLKLSDGTADTSGVNDGVAATPSAVRLAYNLAKSAGVTAADAMPLTGGTFKGTVAAMSQNISGAYVRNIRVQNSSNSSQSTNFIIMVRK